MSLHMILFLVFAAVAVVSSVQVIVRKNPVISALFLILNFAALSGLYLLLNAQFIAVVQVIVYAGAIMVLFLFVIMLLRPENEPAFFEVQPKLKGAALALAVLVFIQVGLIIFIGKPGVNMVNDPARSIEVGTIEYIGRELYTTYFIPFQAAAFLLLAASIGALVLAKKKFD